jgi:hypothetical protein
MNQRWYWIISSVALLGTAYLLRKQGVSMWRRAMERRQMAAGS